MKNQTRTARPRLRNSANNHETRPEEKSESSCSSSSFSQAISLQRPVRALLLIRPNVSFILIWRLPRASCLPELPFLHQWTGQLPVPQSLVRVASPDLPANSCCFTAPGKRLPYRARLRPVCVPAICSPTSLTECKLPK